MGDHMTDNDTNEAAQKQFPSDAGREDVEIAERTVDTDDDTATVFTKVFVVGLQSDTDFGPLHEANYQGVLQDAINLGLHPKGEPTYVGAEPDQTPGNTRLTYTAEVVPAHVDHDTNSTNTPDESDISE